MVGVSIQHVRLADAHAMVRLTSMLDGCKSIAFMVRLCAAISIANVLLPPPPRARTPMIPKGH